MGTPPPQSSNSRAVQEEKFPGLHCRKDANNGQCGGFRTRFVVVMRYGMESQHLCCPVSLTSGFASTQKREVSRQLAPVIRKISWPSMAVQKCYQELPVARNASMVFYGILWHASLGASQASFKEFSFAAPNAWDLQLPPSSICHCWVKCGAPSQGVVPVPLTRQLRWPTLKPGHLEHGRSYWLLHWNPSVRCPGGLLTWTKLQSKGNNMASWQPWLHGKKQSIANTCDSSLLHVPFVIPCNFVP